MASLDASTTGDSTKMAQATSSKVETGQDLPSRRFGQLVLPKASMLAILVFTIVLRPYSLVSRKSFPVRTNSEALLACLPSSARSCPAFNPWRDSLHTYTFCSVKMTST